MEISELFGSPLRVRLLALLVGQPGQRYDQRQLAERSGFNLLGVQKELKRLLALGLVTREAEGRQVYYQANPQHPWFPELRNLMLKTVGLVDVLREALEPLAAKVKVAFVYGSLAAGEETAESDIDLMVVGNVEFGEMADALAPVHDRLGREVNPTVYPVKEFREKLQAGHHFLNTVLRDEKLFVIGDADELNKLVS